MAVANSDPFNAVGGITVGIPAIPVIAPNGAITANVLTISNVLGGNATYTGNVTAANFIGNFVGNISGNIRVPGNDTEVVFGIGGNACTSPKLTFDPVIGFLHVMGNMCVEDTMVANYYYGDGSNLANVAAATVTANAQPNITSLGTLTTLTVAGPLTITAPGNILIPGGNVGDVLKKSAAGGMEWGLAATSSIANGSSNVNIATAGGPPTISSGGTANVIVVNPGNTVITGEVWVSGNVRGTYFDGNGARLTGLNAANLIGAVPNAAIAGTVYVAAQPNITSVGTLTGLTVNGVTNLGPNGNVRITGGSPGQVLSSDGVGGLLWQSIALSNAITDGNSSVRVYPNANVTINANGVSNVAVFNEVGTVLKANFIPASDNVYSLGNATRQWQSLWVSGNTIYMDGVPISLLGSTIEGVNANRLVVDGNVGVLYDDTNGNIRGNAFIGTSFWGDAGNLANIPGANIAGSIANAVYSDDAGNAANATNVIGASQPNITSVGTLTSLTVSGTATAGDFSTAGNVTAAGNVTGANGVFSVVYGQLAAGPQPNLTSVGTLSSLTVSGAIVAGNVFANGGAVQALVGNFGTVAGTILTNAQPYITSLGALTGLTVVGNASFGNLSAPSGTVSANTVTGNYFAVASSRFIGDILPSANVTYNLGSPALRWKDLYLSNNSLYLGTAKVSATGNTVVVPSLTVANGVVGDFSPNANLGANLGSPTQRWKDVYLSNNSLYLGFAHVTSYGPVTAPIVQLPGLQVTGSVVGNLIPAANGTFVIGSPSSQWQLIGAGSLQIGNTTLTSGPGGSLVLGSGNSIQTITPNGTSTSNSVVAANSVTTNVLIANTANIVDLNATGDLDVHGNVYANGGIYANADSQFATDVYVGGNLIVTGNLTYTDINTLSVIDPIIDIGGGPNGSPLTSNDGRDRGELLHTYNDILATPVDKFIGWKNSTDSFIIASNVSVSNNLVTVYEWGTLEAGLYIGDGGGLSNIAAGNITGNVAVADYAQWANIANVANSVSGANVVGQVANAAYALFANVADSANTVDGSGVTGVVANAQYAVLAGTANVANTVDGSGVTGIVANAEYANVANIANVANSIDGSGVTGTVANANYAVYSNNVIDSSQPNITSVGVLTSLDVTGPVDLGDIANITISGGSNGQFLQTDGNGGLTWSNGGSGNGQAIINGSSNVTVAANGNVTVGVAGIANIAVFSNTGVITGNLIVGGIANLGNVGNLRITGGSNGQILTSNGNGGVSWLDQSVTTAYLYARRTTNQTISSGSWANRDIVFNSVTTSNNVTYSTSTGIFTLKAGVTYRITAGVAWSAQSTYLYQIGVYSTANTLLSPVFESLPPTSSTNNFSPSAIDWLYTPTVDTNAKIRTTSSTNALPGEYIRSDIATYLSIQAVAGQIGPTTLAALSDVQLANLANGQVLTYNSAANIWINTTPDAANANYANTAGSANTANTANVANISNTANVALSVAGANVTGVVANANYAAYAGNVTVAAQPNITSVGTLAGLTVGGNVTVTGNLAVTGNTTYVNVTTIVVEDPVIQLGGGPNGSPLTVADGRDRGTYLHVFDSGANAEIDKFMGWDTSNSEFAFGSNVTMANDVVTFNTYGNIRAGYFIGDGSQLSNLNIGNASVANANYANAANIANVANIANTANFALSIDGANVTGEVANANYALYSNIADSANSVALANVAGIGNIAAINLDGNAQNVLRGDGTWSADTTDYGNANVANYLPTYTGNISANYVVATYDVSANVVLANYVHGDGSNLTNIGYAANANYSNYTDVANVANVANSVALANVVGIGNIANINLSGNTSEYLRGDGAWSAIDTSGIANGTSNISIANANGNISVTVGGSTTWTFANSGIVFPDGTTQATAFPGVISGSPYRGFNVGLNRFWGDDPSVNQLIITNTPSAPTFQNLSSDTDDDAFQASNLGSANIVVMLNLYGSSDTEALDPTVLENLAKAFIDNVLYNGATPVTDATTAKSRFYSTWTPTFGPLVLDNSLYELFQFLNPVTFSGVAATGGTGSGFIPNLINDGYAYLSNGQATGSSGYTVGDILTVTGDQYGGTTPTNDATFTVTAVDGSGAVTNYTVTGTPSTNAWPYDNINDGGSDQYDSGNYIRTSASGGNDIPYGAGEIQSGTTSDWGAGSNWVTVYRYSTWAMMAFDTNVTSCRYAGNMGADGSGDKQAQTLIGGSGGIGIGEFLFSNNVLTLQSANSMYIKGPDDLYLDALTDDIQLRSADSVVIKTGVTSFANGAAAANWQYTATGNIIFPDNSEQNTAWTGTVALSNVSGAGNIAAINLDGNVSNILRGDGTWGPDAAGTYGNSDVANFLAAFGSNTILTTGNISGGNISASGNITFNNWANTAGGTDMILNPGTSKLRALANVEPYHNDSWRLGADNARWSTVYANAGNFSGTLRATSITLTSTGTAVNASSGNILTNKVTGTSFDFLSGLYTIGLTTGSTNANYTITLPANAGSNGQVLRGDGNGALSWTDSIANANYAAYANIVVGASQPNITSVGTLTTLTVAGNVIVQGNLAVQGNLTYIDVSDLRVVDPIIEMGGGPNGAPLSANDGYDRGSLLHYYTTAPIDAFMGYKNSTGEFIVASNVSASNNVVTVNTYGNLRLDTVIGNVDGSSITTVDLTANGTVTLGNVGNISITGGSNGYVLSTDGSGNLSWVTNDSGEPIANALIASTQYPTGFDEATNLTGTTISYNNATRTFTIAPVGATFDVWVKGTKYTKTTESVVTGATTGAWYIYYNSSGTLTASTTPWNIGEVATVSYIYWNNTLGSAQMFFDERHGTSMDAATHEYLHRTRGASISTVPSLGFVLTANTGGDGNSDIDAEIGLSSGTFYDEDIQVDVVASTTPTPNTWEQNLTLPGQIPVLYRSGSAWVLDSPTNFPVKFGSARPVYNLNTGGTWSTPDVSNNGYFVQWIVATNNLNYPVISIMGQDEYATLATAQAATFADLDLQSLPIAELRVLYGLVLQTANGYTNTVKARLRSYSDVRIISTAAASLTTNAVDVAFRETPQTVFSNDATANAAWANYVGNYSGNINYTGSNVTLGNVSNLHITGGSAGQLLATDGNGTLSFTAPFNLSVGNLSASNGNAFITTYSNVTTLGFDEDSGFSVDNLGNGVVKIGINSTFKYWEVNGNTGLIAEGLDTVNFIAGDGVTIEANNNATPKTFTISASGAGGGNIGGSNTQIQYNDGGNFAGASDFTYNKTSGLVSISNTNSGATGIVLGNPSLGNLISNALTLTNSTSVSNSIALINQILGKLVPPAPPQFPASQSISIASLSTYRMANFTQTDNTPGANKSVSGGTTVTSVRRAASYNANVINTAGPGDSGTITVYLNGANAGSRTLTTALDGNGTYSNLVIFNNYDYNVANSSITAGFWSVFSARAAGSVASGWNEVYISDSAAGNTNTPSWYYDASTPGTPTFSNTSISVTTSNVIYTSTVPHYTSSTQFTLGFDINRLSGDMYPTSDTFATGTAGGAFQAPSSRTYAQANITTPLARNLYVSSGNVSVTTTSNITTGFGSSSTGPVISVTNSYNTGTNTFSPGVTVLYKTGTASTMEEANIRFGSTVGSGSALAFRIVNPGSSDTPTYSANATAFNSQTSTLETYDATIVAATLKHDQTNYSSGYLPAGPDLSSGRTGAQYFTFKFVRTSVSKFDIKWTGTLAGLWVALPGSTIDSTSGLNGWLSMATAYGGAGVPGSNTGAGGNGSDGAALGGVAPLNSAQTNKSVTATFGTVSSSSTATNEIYVRIKLTSGQTITALSLETASN